jgi:hypothetical protein
MSEHVKVRLQGGPHDGERQTKLDPAELGPRIYVERCRICGGHWFREPVMGAEVYRRDDEDEKGWIVYCFTDSNMNPQAETDERELVPAGGIPDDDENIGMEVVLITASYAGKCPGCGEPITEGDNIGRVDGDWCCADCVDEQGEDGYDREAANG